MAIYSASLQQLERMRNGKRSLVRAAPPAAALQL
jgi:hypothetical protein